jgi:putative PIN family toxin of toxin-antitoxin system
MKVVLDTNIIISGLNFPGNERRILDLARTSRFDLYLSPFILQETEGVLMRKFGWDEERALQAVRILRSWATIVDPSPRLSAVQQDDADNRILECAQEAAADLLVTGDRRHLLPLKQLGNTRIVSSAEFLSLLI